MLWSISDTRREMAKHSLFTGFEVLLYFIVKSMQTDYANVPTFQAMFPKERHEKEWVDLTFGCLPCYWKYLEDQKYVDFNQSKIYTNSSYLVNAVDLSIPLKVGKESLLSFLRGQTPHFNDFIKENYQVLD